MTHQLLTAQESIELLAWVRLLKAHAALTRLFNRELTADHGLTVNDYEVLLLLSQADDSRMRRVDLANQVRLTASGMTRLLGGLQAAGYVEKAECISDARVTYAVLTDSGLGKLKQASKSHVAAVQALFQERYTKQELRTLAELLGRLPGAAEADPEACIP